MKRPIEACYDNSQLSTFQKCPMAYYLQYIKRLRKIEIDDTNDQLNFGSYAHKFWEAHFGKSDATFPSIVEGYEEPDDLPQYSLKALEFFCRTYHEKYSVPDKAFHFKEVEQVCSFDIDGFTFIVKSDGIFEQSSNLFGLENKTTRSLSYNYFDKFFLSSQISAQCYNIWQKYNRCSGILLNVGEIKKLKRKPSGDYDGVMPVEDGFVTCKFSRDYCNRNKSELDDWKENTILWLNRIEDAKHYHQFPKSTGLWGGTICAKCEYKELCKVSVGKKLDESILDVLYEETDPYDYLKTK